MMTSLTDWNLPDRDVVRLREVLHDDERVVLVAKPRVKMHGSDVFFVMLPGVVLVAFLLERMVKYISVIEYLRWILMEMLKICH